MLLVITVIFSGELSEIDAASCDANSVVVDPASTGGVQVAIVRDLLPGDPRL